VRNKNHQLSRAVTARQHGFTIIEVVVGIAIFAILALGVLGCYTALSRSVRAARQKVVLSTLAAERLEIVRNIPYSQVGTVNGNPSGNLPDLSNPYLTTLEGIQYKVYYEVTYIDDSADGTILAGTDPAPNDYKQVKMSILNTKTNQTTPFVTNVSPKGLESISNAGALLIKVFDANGQPIEDATVAIDNTILNPDIHLSRSSDSAGNWIEVGLPASTNGYHITVTKNGYSTDATVPISGGNPNPTKPDSTILVGQVTQVSFSIDLLSNLTVRTLDQVCAAQNGVNVNVKGAKIIGTNPTVYKYSQNFTSASGQISITNFEWDTYTPTLLTGQSVMVYGTSPIQQISVLPGTSQTFTLILGAATTHSILIIVKDASTGLSIEGATVQLHKGGASPADYSGTTGGSVWTQSNWSAGAGQVAYSNTSKYFADDGNADVTTVPTGVRLKKVGANYVASASLESSTFDTGGASNFTTLTWQPASQSGGTVLKFQIASNTDNLTWNFIGPDGTAATYYTVPGTSINSVHDNNQYVRYKAFLSTTNPALTPVLTSIGLNYVAGCFTPGQVMFPGLTSSSSYTLTVSMPGYTTKVINNLNINGNQVLEVDL
jgi:prepilin-type N-terminal cleavage/methylation domain-containing protein